MHNILVSMLCKQYFKMKIISFIVVAICVIYAVYKVYSKSSVDSDLNQLLKQNPIILDVRTASEFQDGHIVGSVNIALSKLRTSSLSELDKTRPIITCCSHGLRSIKAIEVLKGRGFSNVHNGGAWTELEGRISTTK